MQYDLFIKQEVKDEGCLDISCISIFFGDKGQSILFILQEGIIHCPCIKTEKTFLIYLITAQVKL